MVIQTSKENQSVDWAVWMYFVQIPYRNSSGSSFRLSW